MAGILGTLQEFDPHWLRCTNGEKEPHVSSSIKLGHISLNQKHKSLENFSYTLKIFNKIEELPEKVPKRSCLFSFFLFFFFCLELYRTMILCRMLISNYMVEWTRILQQYPTPSSALVHHYCKWVRPHNEIGPTCTYEYSVKRVLEYLINLLSIFLSIYICYDWVIW